MNQESCLLQLREENLDLLALRVHGVVALILVVAERREIPNAIRELPEFFREAERGKQAIGTVRERALERGVAGDARFELLVSSFPRLPVRVDVAQIPLELVRDLLAPAAPRLRWLRCGDVRRVETFSQRHLVTIVE